MDTIYLYKQHMKERLSSMKIYAKHNNTYAGWLFYDNNYQSMTLDSKQPNTSSMWWKYVFDIAWEPFPANECSH